MTIKSTKIYFFYSKYIMVKNTLLDSERNKQIYKMYTTTNSTALEVATKFGLTESSVRRIIREIKNPAAHKTTQKAGKPKVTKKIQDTSDFVDKAIANRDPKTGERIESQNINPIINTIPTSGNKSTVRVNKNEFKKIYESTLAIMNDQINK